jgi:hypothetical protein
MGGVLAVYLRARDLGGAADHAARAATLTIARAPSIGRSMMTIALEILFRRRRARAPART